MGCVSDGDAPGQPEKPTITLTSETFGEQDGLAKSFRVAGGVLGVRMDGIAVTTESGDVNPTILEFFLPGFGFGRVRQEFIDWTVMCFGITSGADFHGFEAEGADFIEHGVHGKVFVYRIKYADGNLAHG